MMRRTGKEALDFERRLTAYSALAGAILVAAPAARGAVNKTVVNLNDQTLYEFDFNTDGTTDFRVRVATYMAPGGTGYYVGAFGRAVEGATPYYLAALDSGYTVGPSQSTNWGNLARGTKGSWGGVNEKFLGIRFDADPTAAKEYHYGWIKLSVRHDGTFAGTSFDVHEYAWEDVEDQPVVTGSDVSLPVELASFSARYESGVVNLSWATESETDNLGYILERKTAGTDWQEIASFATDDELEGAGNTSSRTEYSFADDDVLPGETYTYRLSDVDTDGTVTVKDVISIELDGAPVATALKPATPNPFNPNTKIVFDIAENTDVTLSVVDMMGRTVQTIIPGQRHSAGSYSIHWNGKTDDGVKAASGMYLLVLKAGSVRKTQKVMLVR